MAATAPRLSPQRRQATRPRHVPAVGCSRSLSADSSTPASAHSSVGTPIRGLPTPQHPRQLRAGSLLRFTGRHGGAEPQRTRMIVYANFRSDLAVHLAAHEVLDRWAEHASREIWLTRPGDVLVTPSLAFRRYAGELTAIPHESVTVLSVPPVAGTPFNGSRASCRSLGHAPFPRRDPASHTVASHRAGRLDSRTRRSTGRARGPIWAQGHHPRRPEHRVPPEHEKHSGRLPLTWEYAYRPGGATTVPNSKVS